MQYEQNTIEWLQWRRSKIGASDAPVIMNRSPFCTAYELWYEKVAGVKRRKSYAMERGHELEPIARRLYEVHMGMKFAPQVKIHPKYEWMIASLDGISEDGNHIIEIKCPKNPHSHDIAVGGKIPEHYQIQMQHQMEVCGVKESTYVSFYDNAIVILQLEYDAELCKEMLEYERKFYESMRSLTPPEKYS